MKIFLVWGGSTYAFEKYRPLFAFWGKLTKGKHKWLRNNGSTMVSINCDTAIFITLAFWGVGFSLWRLIISQYVLKLIIALCDTPFFYLFTAGYRFNPGAEENN